MVKKRVVKKTGTAKEIVSAPMYPKSYSIKITKSKGDKIHIRRRCENMTAWELYGLLKMLTLEIEKQIMPIYDVAPGETQEAT